MPTVTFVLTNKQIKAVEAAAGKTILQVALDNGVPMENACGGNGFCTTCLCKIQKGAESLSPRNDREESMGITGNDRLGCQTTVTGDVTVELAEM